jgi:hypothetical protein
MTLSFASTMRVIERSLYELCNGDYTKAISGFYHTFMIVSRLRRYISLVQGYCVDEEEAQVCDNYLFSEASNYWIISRRSRGKSMKRRWKRNSRFGDLVVFPCLVRLDRRFSVSYGGVRCGGLLLVCILGLVLAELVTVLERLVVQVLHRFTGTYRQVLYCLDNLENRSEGSLLPWGELSIGLEGHIV